MKKRGLSHPFLSGYRPAGHILEITLTAFTNISAHLAQASLSAMLPSQIVEPHYMPCSSVHLTFRLVSRVGKILTTFSLPPRNDFKLLLSSLHGGPIFVPSLHPVKCVSN